MEINFFFLELTFFFSLLGRVLSGKKHSIGRTLIRCRKSQIYTRNPKFCGNASPIWGNSRSFQVIKNSMKHSVCHLTRAAPLSQPTSLLHYLQAEHWGCRHTKKEKRVQEKVSNFKLPTLIRKSRRCTQRPRKNYSTPYGLYWWNIWLAVALWHPFVLRFWVK